MSDSPKNGPPPPCPRCRSRNTIQIHEHFGEMVYFCADCEYSWDVRPGVPSRPEKARLSEDVRSRRGPTHDRLDRLMALWERAAAARLRSHHIIARATARLDAYLYRAQIQRRAAERNHRVH